MEYRRIDTIKRGKKLYSGGEADIYKISSNQLYKEFPPVLKSIQISERKQRKLEKLVQIEELNGCYPHIDYLVMNLLNEWMRGYVMEYVKDAKRLFPFNFTLEEKINVLTNLRERLEILNRHGVYYFDIREPNLLWKDNRILFLDIDDVQLEEEAIDLIPSDLRTYLKHGGNLDRHAQTLMVNLLTDSFLTDEEANFTQEGEDLLEDLLEKKVDARCDHEYLYEYIRR